MSASLGSKRKRVTLPAVIKPSAAPSIKFANAQAFRDALREAEPEAAKDALIAIRNQLTVKFDEPPVSATDPRVKLANEYLEKSPGAAEIFDAWDLAINTNHPLLLPLPLAALSSLIALLSPLSFFHPLLSPILTRLISPQIIRSITQYLAGTRTDLILVSLKALAESVKVGERWAGRVWEALAGSGGVNAKVWGKLLGMRRKISSGAAGGDEGGGKKSGSNNPFASPDIRVLSLNFLLSLLLSPHLPTKLAILSQSSVIRAMFKPVPEDHVLVVQRLLQAWWEVWFLEKRIARGTKVAAFTSDVVGEILKLYSSVMSRKVSIGGDAGIEGYSARSLGHHFLISILTVPGAGLCFQDQGWYPRGFESETVEDVEEGGGRKGGAGGGGGGGVHNKVVREVLRTIGSEGLVGDEDGVAELVLKILEGSPELVASYWASSGITLDPRLSSRFLISTAHLSAIVSLPIPIASFRMPTPSSSAVASTSSTPTLQAFRPTPPPLNNIIENILPSIFPKQFSTKGLLSKHPLVQQTTAVTLSRCLSKLHQVFNTFLDVQTSLEEGDHGLWTVRRVEIEREMRKRVPDVQTVVGFAMAAAKTASAATTEEESTRAAVLTEAALRLLSLYHLTLPALVAEAKFDVGKLLVPGGEKGKGKEEVDAVGGTGDGWGFARSNVFGVEALTQLHVLRLVGEGGEFAWGGRAGSSPNTYIYHLLALYLSTPHPATRTTSSALITRLLSSSVLFEHDPSEITIWLESMISNTTSSIQDVEESATPTEPSLSSDNEILLTFLDDSIRRCLKTPYKYLEDSLHFVVSTGEPISPKEAPSPLLVTLLEQLAAKVKGKLLTPKEVAPIAAYIRRLAFGLLGKQRDLAYGEEVARRLDESLEKSGGEEVALEKGLLKKQLGYLTGAGLASESSSNGGSMDVDEVSPRNLMDLDPSHGDTWTTLTSSEGLSTLPFAYIFLHASLPQLSDASTSTTILSTLPSAPSLPLLQRSIRHVTHRITGLLSLPRTKSSSSKSKSAVISDEVASCLQGCLRVLKGLVERVKELPGGANDALKRELVADAGLKELLMMEKVPKGVRAVLAEVVDSCFDARSSVDRQITASYQDWAVTVLAKTSLKSLSKYAEACAPWIHFLALPALIASADSVLSIVSVASDEKTAPHVATLLLSIFTALKKYPTTPATLSLAKRSLPILLPLGMLTTVVDLLETSLPLGYSPAAQSSFTIKDAVITADSTASGSFVASSSSPDISIDFDLFAGGLNDEKAALLAPLLYQSESAREVFGRWLASNLESVPSSSIHALASPLAAFLDVNSSKSDPSSTEGWKACEIAFPRLLATFLVLSASSEPTVASTKTRELVGESLASLAQFNSEESAALIESSLAGVVSTTAAFTSSVCDLFLRLAKLGLPLIFKPVVAFLDASMEWLVRQVSGTDEDSVAVVAFFGSLNNLVKLQVAGSTLKTHLIEPIFTAILQDRLTSEYALDLVISLAPRTSMKPAIVVRNLQLLLSNRSFSAIPLSSTPRTLRARIVSTIRALFDMSPATCCQPAHIEPLMALYRGTPDHTDRTILSIFHLFERHRRISVASLLTSWSPDGLPSMSSSRRPLDIIVALDPAKVLRTCTSFPTRRSFNPQDLDLDAGDIDLQTLYDPVYLLAAYAAVLIDGELGLGNELSGLDWVEVVRSNVLGLVVCALSSRKEDMRSMASFLIAKTYSYIQETMFQEQTQLLYTLNLLRHSCPAPSEDSTIPHRSPTVITLFFAQTLRSIGNPSSFVYPAASRFLLQRPEVDAGDVPLLYGMLYSSDDGWKQERSWIVKFLRDGMRSAEDWRILQRRHTFSLLASLFQSTPDLPIRRLILEVFINMTQNPTACVALVRREGFLSWIGIQMGLLRDEKEIVVVVKGGEEKAELEMEVEEVWLRLVENVVVNLGAEDAKKAEEKGDGKVGKASWRGEVLALVARAVKGADQIRTLHLASSILLRLSLLPSTLATVTPSLSSVVDHLSSRLFAVESTLAILPSPSPSPRKSLWISENLFVPSTDSSGSAWSGTVENLWRAALEVGAGEEGLEREVMERLSARSMVTGGEVGSWVRKEWVGRKVVV